MEQKSSNILPYRHISEPAGEIIQYIEDRHKGLSESLMTRWKKFNLLCMGGIEPNTIYTIAGISGSGKSSFVNSLESDLFDLNPNGNFIVLNFSLEMMGSRQVGRKLSYKLKKTTNELYNGGAGKKLNEADMSTIKETAKEIIKDNIYYVDVPGSLEEIKTTIIHFMNTVAKGKWLIVILDHILLTRRKYGESERNTIAELQYLFIELKKYGRTTIIQLSQLNREIETTERVNNPFMHYPIRSDLFGSDSIFQAADYIMVLHRPELLHIPDKGYGPKGQNTTNLIYMHILKNREGDLGIIKFDNNLKYNRMDEHVSTKEEQSQLLLQI